MEISKNKNYLVLNYGTSPVAVSTKYENYLIAGMDGNIPGSLPLNYDEIFYINSQSHAFKIGLLRFQEDEQEALYETLRIQNWQDILTNEQIEDILVNPTADSLQKLVNIESDMYFERVRGVYMGLKNSSADVSVKVADVIEARRKELASGIRKTEIRVNPEKVRRPPDEVDDLKRQIKEMKAMMDKMMGNDNVTAEPANEQKTEDVKSEESPDTRRRGKSTPK